MTASAELRRLLDQATPGPWAAIHASRGMVVSVQEVEGRGPIPLYNPTKDSADAALIVFLVNHASALADLIDAAEEMREAEWMVTHDWGGDRDAVLARLDAVLARLQETQP